MRGLSMEGKSKFDCPKDTNGIGISIALYHCVNDKMDARRRYL